MGRKKKISWNWRHGGQYEVIRRDKLTYTGREKRDREEAI